MAGLLSRTAMTAALTPALALDYLRALSADLRAAVLLSADGEHVAGPEALAAPARALLEAGPELHGTSHDAHVFAAASDLHAVVVITGPQVLIGLMRHDLHSVLTALGGGIHAGPPKTAPEGLVEALIAASRRRV